MKINQVSTTTHSSIINKAMTFFSSPNRNKRKHKTIYWVIDEPEQPVSDTLVKFYDDNDRLLFKKIFPEYKAGVLDEVLMQQLDKIKDQIRRKMSLGKL